MQPFLSDTTEFALLSCYDKTGIVDFARRLVAEGLVIISTGGTYHTISEGFAETDQSTKIMKVSDITSFPEILNGRVKTLHPLIHGALLTDWDNQEHVEQAKQHGIPRISVVAVNLYPFWNVVDVENNATITKEDAIELIDIGGVAMIRAAAKNYKHISVFSSPSQYDTFGCARRFELAKKAFETTARYDTMIASYFNSGGDDDDKNACIVRNYRLSQPLKYGCNPHQVNPGTAIYAIDGQPPPPFSLLNGKWSYINVLDAASCWGLVTELASTTDRAAACSFKHTSPAGAAVSMTWCNLDEPIRILLEKLYGKTYCDVIKGPPSDALNAYIRARNADPMSSFGDFIGVSETVDEVFAQFLSEQISDGIVAPAYTSEALSILKSKKKGNYVIVLARQNDIQTRPDPLEFREIGGFAIAQPVNTRVIDKSDLTSSHHIVVPVRDGMESSTVVDLIVANACLKYAQSNNVACAYQGQLVGLSAGQQSRVHSVRLACAKADVWKRRHNPAGIAMFEMFRSDVRRQAIVNATTALAEDSSRFFEEYGDLLQPGNANTLKQMSQNNEDAFKPDLSLASDAFFPFPDSIHAAHLSGVRYISQPGGSTRDEEVNDVCKQHNIAMIHHGVRIFTH